MDRKRKELSSFLFFVSCNCAVLSYNNNLVQQISLLTLNSLFLYNETHIVTK